MKILFFIENLGPGGKERRLTELIYDLVKNHGYECTIVLTKLEIHYDKLRNINIQPIIIEKTHKKDLSIFYKFYKIAKQLKPDIIHVWGNLAATYAIPAKLFLKIPLINNQITDAPCFSKINFNYKVNFFFSDKIIANSEAGLKSYNVKKTEGLVIYNGFDFNRIKNITDRETLKNRLNIHSKFVIGMVATFSLSKDYQTYIDAALKILEYNQDISFLCIGSGDNQMYKNQIPKKFEDKIKFTGAIKDVESLINICDIGVLTSFGEGISNAILEFMALSKPVIATNLGATSELIEDDISGFLINESAVQELENYLLLLINDDKRRQQMGERGFEIVNQKFGMKRMTDEFLSVYEKIIKK